MKNNTIVEYHTSIGSSGYGRVIAYIEETEIVTVMDIDDNSIWTGPGDKTEIQTTQNSENIL
jgi:hypothetical protein